MKIDTMEKTKLVELGTSMVVANTLNFTGNLNELTSFLCMVPYLIDVLTTFRREKKTKEYKEIENLYNEVIKNTVNLMKECGVEDPIEVFAMYVYMYRHGYLSHNKEYNYSTKMKDFSGLQGLDMIRGLGVCRSAAGLYRDICDEMGMNASVIMVNAKNAIHSIEKLCDKDKPEADDKTKKFVKSVVMLTKVLPISNHAITTVEKDGINYVLDPMNDGFLYMNDNNKLVVANNKDYYMKLNMLTTQFSRLVYGFKTAKTKQLYEQLYSPSIKYNDYKNTYLDVLNYCKSNIDIFEEFYKENKEIYSEIYNKAEEHGGLISRVSGFDQGRKLIKKLEQKPQNNIVLK